MIAESVGAGRDGATGYACGPLDLRVHAEPALRAKLVETLRLYDVVWDAPRIAIDVTAIGSAADAARAGATTLHCARMAVDDAPDGLYASTRSGASARQHRASASWNVTVPEALIAAGALEELEDILSLILTDGWREAGWVPIHAAALERDGRCTLVCAATGGGKTTVTASLVRRGWRTLGDDKLLLRIIDGVPELAALLHTFNLHPRTQTWFPEVGSLDALPRYSAWTEKRKVRANGIWPGLGALRARPVRLVVLERSEAHSGVRTQTLARTAIVDALLRQTVIPRDPRRAAGILRTVATTAARIDGLRLEVGIDAYADPAALDALERAVGGWSQI